MPKSTHTMKHDNSEILKSNIKRPVNPLNVISTLISHIHHIMNVNNHNHDLDNTLSILITSESTRLS